MATQVFINLPVKDLKKTMDFFAALGFEFNPQFTNDDAACMIINEGASYAMLLREEFFKTFIKKDIADATKTTEVLICLSRDSVEEVKDMVNKAVAAGGTLYSEPMDHGFMYQHAFADLDGHLWEVMFMDMSKVPADVHQAAETN
ncbi:MAG: glyoxalase/bleomycin resistance/extradiol dioxygenase family protein [Sphingobacteriales bacterium]|nr:MAG: glyoxalase/bleomycin resistance/extradiol dioxygenase family protein [Sphingobacteriales bacterium]